MQPPYAGDALRSFAACQSFRMPSTWCQPKLTRVEGADAAIPSLEMGFSQVDGNLVNQALQEFRRSLSSRALAPVPNTYCISGSLYATCRHFRQRFPVDLPDVVYNARFKQLAQLHSYWPRRARADCNGALEI